MTRPLTRALVALGTLGACKPHHAQSLRATAAVHPTPPPAPPESPSRTTHLALTLLPGTAPVDVMVHVPRALDLNQPVYAMVFFHAATVCAAEFVWHGDFDRTLCRRGPGRSAGWSFSIQHDLAHTNTILVVPQLHTGRDLALGLPGGIAALLDGVSREVSSQRAPAAPPLHFAGTVFAAHSLGGTVLLKALAHPDVARDVRAVMLFDTLGDRADTVLSWWRAPDGAPSRRLLIVKGDLAQAITLANTVAAELNRESPSSVVARVGDLTRDLEQHPAIVMQSQMPHPYIPYPYFTKALTALGLPSRRVEEPWETLLPHAPVAIALGETVEGRLLPPDAREGEARRYRDYALSLSAGQCAEITLRGGPARWQPRGMLDMRLQVFSGGARVLDDDDGAGAASPGRELFDSQARWCAREAATVIVRASARTDYWQGGAFTLTTR